MKLKNYTNYNEIPKKYKFDLEAILEGQSIDYYFDQLDKSFAAELIVKESKYKNFDDFYKSIKNNEKIMLILNKLSNYISNYSNTDVTNGQFNMLMQKLEIKLQNFSSQNGSEINRIYENEDKIKEYLKDKKMASYRKSYNSIFEDKKYKLSDEIENFIVKSQKGNISAQEVFEILESGEIYFNKAKDSKDKEHEVTRASRVQLLQSLDPVLRKNTFYSYSNAYLKHKDSFSNLLYQHFKSISSDAQLRKYNSSVESIIHEDRVNPLLLSILYKKVQASTEIFKNYYRAKSKYFKIKFNKSMEQWDGFVKLVKTKNEYSVEEAQKMVLEAFKPFNEEYNGVVKKAFSENWIDYMSTPQKRSGAYSIGESYGLEKKYILMNFDGTLRSVETIAHEMGHSLHSYYSDTYQDLENSSYPIFLAEIASIFNELMLQDYLINQKISDKEKFSILANGIEAFYGTVNRQTMWSEFEFELYKKVDENIPVGTFDQISQIYLDVAKKYDTNPKKEKKPGIDSLYSIIVPHFYNHFYVYKYAVGYIVANYFFTQYKKEGKKALETYIDKFLKKGCVDWPVEILKDAGADLYNEKIYDEAFKIIKDKIDKYIKLGNKIFKK